VSRKHEPIQCISIAIDDALNGQRLDYALASACDLSRSRIQQLIAEGAVFRKAPGHDGAEQDETVSKHAVRVFSRQVYEIHLPENTPLCLQAEEIALDILFEDEHLIVVNKPPGMVVHPSHGHDSGTLVHALLHHCPNLPGINGVERPGIVHRIDKDTSGSLVIAKTQQAHQRLVEMFARHDIRREYLAWCRGVPRWREQNIDLPIARHPQQRQKMSVQPHGRPATTIAFVEAGYRHDFCRLRLALHTGRTHQIRVHLSHHHLPILGDTVYGRSYRPGSNIPVLAREAVLSLKRQALHAEVLGMKHPVSGVPLLFTAPLPEDLAVLSAALDAAYG
jgi:23S rRNA pseudouridine1911/1915/1917 synthase